MLSNLKSIVRDETGATMIEYGLIAALVSVVAIAALGSLGGQLQSMYTKVATCLQTAQGGSSTC